MYGVELSPRSLGLTTFVLRALIRSMTSSREFRALLVRTES